MALPQCIHSGDGVEGESAADPRKFKRMARRPPYMPDGRPSNWPPALYAKFLKSKDIIGEDRFRQILSSRSKTAARRVVKIVRDPAAAMRIRQEVAREKELPRIANEFRVRHHAAKESAAQALEQYRLARGIPVRDEIQPPKRKKKRRRR